MRKPLRSSLAPLRALGSRVAWSGPRAGESLALVTLLAVLGFYLVLALLTPAMNYDANTYRLSRIAHWLQEGSLYHVPTNDVRQNWIGQNADLVMLWLTGFFRREYPLVQLAQYGGGLLACLAVVELGGWLGLSRLWRLAAALSLVAIPTVGTQFISAQTDLFTAGCLAAAVALIPAALRERSVASWIPVGAGVGLALGAKVTTLYALPGGALLVVGWAAIDRRRPAVVLRGGAVVALVALPLAGFNPLLNAWNYGNPLAPAAVLTHAGGARIATLAEKAPPVSPATVNAMNLFWLLLDPRSNPMLPAKVYEPAFESLAGSLAAHRSPLREQQRAIAAGRYDRSSRPLTEDEASFGLVVPAAVLLGALLALVAGIATRQPERLRVATLAAATGGTLAIFSLRGWVGEYEFWYLCLLAPWVALLAADLFARWRARPVRVTAVLFLGVQAATALHVGIESRNQGVRVLRDPAAASRHALALATRGAALHLGSAPLDVGFALPMDSWLAPLYRAGLPHR